MCEELLAFAPLKQQELQIALRILGVQPSASSAVYYAFLNWRKPTDFLIFEETTLAAQCNQTATKVLKAKAR